MRTRNRGTIPGMDEPTELQYDGYWRTAVWASEWDHRAGRRDCGLIVMWSGSTPWVLASERSAAY